MNKIILLIFTFTTINGFTQDLTCEDFKEGTFIGTTPQLPGVEWKIIRTEKNQSESLTKIPQKYIDIGMPLDTLHAKIERIDKCAYRFTYDETKMKLAEYQKKMNDTGGILVEMEKIEGKCFYYVSKSIIDNKEIIIEGKLCKEN
nr:hypothetical protein [uncultured Psychroserpens sp.]